jgi:hypothetical protein
VDYFTLGLVPGIKHTVRMQRTKRIKETLEHAKLHVTIINDNNGKKRKIESIYLIKQDVGPSMPAKQANTASECTSSVG